MKPIQRKMSTGAQNAFSNIGKLQDGNNNNNHMGTNNNREMNSGATDTNNPRQMNRMSSDRNMGAGRGRGMQRPPSNNNRNSAIRPNSIRSTPSSINVNPNNQNNNNNPSMGTNNPRAQQQQQPQKKMNPEELKKMVSLPQKHYKFLSFSPFLKRILIFPFRFLIFSLETKECV